MDNPDPHQAALETLRNAVDESSELIFDDSIERQTARMVGLRNRIEECDPERFEWLREAALEITDQFVRELQRSRYMQLATHGLVKSVRSLVDAIESSEGGAGASGDSDR